MYNSLFISRMNRYLFIFGFETPEKFIPNAECSTDDEDSFAFFLDATDATEALARGREIAAEFARRLFAAAGMESSWSPKDYANWIEHRPLNRFSGQALEMLRIGGSFPEIRFDCTVRSNQVGTVRKRTFLISLQLMNNKF